MSPSGSLADAVQVTVQACVGVGGWQVLADADTLTVGGRFAGAAVGAAVGPGVGSGVGAGVGSGVGVGVGCCDATGITTSRRAVASLASVTVTCSASLLGPCS